MGWWSCVCVSEVWCGGEGALHTRLDVGSGADYTRGCEAHVITSYSLVCYHLSPSARLESFHRRSCLAAFWKLCAANECREEQIVIMNMLWRGISGSSNIWFFSYSLLLELKLLAIKEAANSAVKIPRIISLFKAWTHPLLCTTDWFTLT